MCALSSSGRAMCRRLVFKLQKTVCVVFFYLIFYLLFSFAITPDPPVAFVADDFRIGGKYALMFLVAPHTPIFTDAEGADVFTTRRCGNCFITNNKGFLPMTEYDAILVHGKRNLLSETAAFMEPGKRYLIETSERCVRHKLKCPREPTITSFSTKMSYTLCGLCDELIIEKQKIISN